MKLVKKNRGHGPRTTSTPRPARLTAAPRAEQEAHMYEEMGRRFLLAFTSCQGRITYETARKNFGHITPSEYWMTLAKRVSDDFSSGLMSDPKHPFNKTASRPHGAFNAVRRYPVVG